MIPDWIWPVVCGLAAAGVLLILLPHMSATLGPNASQRWGRMGGYLVLGAFWLGVVAMGVEAAAERDWPQLAQRLGVTGALTALLCATRPDTRWAEPMARVGMVVAVAGLGSKAWLEGEWLWLALVLVCVLGLEMMRRLPRAKSGRGPDDEQP